jgi:hypothetical protein
MIRGATRAANFDPLAGPDILEFRLCHSHVSAKGNLERRSFGDYDKVKLIGEAILDEQRSILVIDLNHGAGNLDKFLCALSLRRSKRQRTEQGKGRYDGS